MKEYKIKDQMYNIDIRILISGDNTAVADYISRKYNSKLEHNNACALHFTLKAKGKSDIEYIWIEKFDWSIENQGTLAHEILHLTFSVMDSLGIKYQREVSEEAYTYYFEHIFKQVWDKLKPAKKNKIDIELDKEYFEIAKKLIQEAESG